ncbi:MAG: 8-amino-7-oxononanoate synthase [Leptothrix sp. (in: b-proteobacteria)]
MLIDHLKRQLDERAAQGLTRRRRVALSPCAPRQVVDMGDGAGEGVHDERELLAFASNDYLGLASHPQLVEALAEAAHEHGVGSGASHYVSGHGRAHEALEAAVHNWLAPGWPEARVLSLGSGYMANLALLTALGHEASTELFTDRLNHASLIDGALLARAQVQRYPHGRIDRLAALLAGSSAPTKLIVTDAVFSMDGDIAPLAELLALAERHDAWLVVDDAHGLGVLGPEGRGSLAALGLCSERLILMGTLGKAVGVHGAFVMAHPVLIEWLLQTARPAIYTTATPPALAAVTCASIALVRGAEGDARRAALQQRIAQFRSGIAAVLARHPGLGWQLAESGTAIQPLQIGANAAASALSQALLARGLWVPAIRPPTVPAGTARLRITLSAAHQSADVEQLLQALAAEAERAEHRLPIRATA